MSSVGPGWQAVPGRLPKCANDFEPAVETIKHHEEALVAPPPFFHLLLL
jgi:hypothetical protein